MSLKPNGRDRSSLRNRSKFRKFCTLMKWRPFDTQRQVQVSTMQDAQHDTQLIEEVVHIAALSQENKKRKFPDEADFGRRAEESDFDWFDELVLPSLEEKTLYMNIASGDEAEDGPEKEQEMTISRMSESYSEFWAAEKGAPKPKRKLRPEAWTGWSENRTKPMTPNTKQNFRRPLRITRRP